MRRAILLISRRTKRIFLSATVVSAVALALLAVSAAWARGRLTPATHDQAAVAPSAANAPGPAALQGNDPEGRLEVELITVRPDGFEPAEIIRADGRFLLAVENRSGLEDLDLQISRQHGERLRETHFSDRLLDWRDVVKLPPGQYVITEANHPAWRCRITINN